jgi:hypothetical protein
MLLKAEKPGSQEASWQVLFSAFWPHSLPAFRPFFGMRRTCDERYGQYDETGPEASIADVEAAR